jgi:hypothetical protein
VNLPEDLEVIKSEEWDVTRVRDWYASYLLRKGYQLKKEQKRWLEEVSEYLAQLCECEISGLDEALLAIKGASQTIFLDGDTLDESKVRAFLKEADEKTAKTIVDRVNQIVSEWKADCELATQLEKRLNQGASGVEVEIIELVKYFKDCWGVKVRVGANTYLFDFEGSIGLLEQELWRLRREQEKDMVTCNCGATYVRTLAMHYLKECSCGTRFVSETAREAGTGYSPELDQLWCEGCAALNLQPPPNRERLRIDDYFENVKYVGKGTTDWRMWLVKKPWKAKPRGMRRKIKN